MDENKYTRGRFNSYTYLPENMDEEIKERLFLIDELKKNHRFAEALDQASLLAQEVTKDIDLATYPLYFSNPYKKLLYWLRHPDYDFKEPDEPIYLILYNLGSLLIECEYPERAKSVLKQAWDLAPYDETCVLEYIESLKSLQEYDEAEETIIKAFNFAMEPERIAHLFRDLGFILIEKKEYYLAAAFYLNSIEFQVSPTVLTELEYIKSITGGKLETNPEELNKFLEKHNIPLNPGLKIVSYMVKRLVELDEEEILSISDEEVLYTVDEFWSNIKKEFSKNFESDDQ